MRKKDYFVDMLLIVATIIWGINPVILKTGLRYMAPLEYNVLRLIIASVVSWAFVALTGQYKRIDRSDFKNILLVSVCGFFIFQWFYALGVSKTTAGNTSIIMGILPVMTAIINHIAGIEKAGRDTYLGIFISFLGMILVIAGTGRIGLTPDNILGSIYMFAGSAGYAVYTVFSKPLSSKYSPYQVTAYSITVSAILILLFSGINIHNYSLSMPLVSSLLFTGVFGICIGNFIWVWCIKKKGSNRVAVYNNLTPVFSVIAGGIFLNETFTLIQFAGAIIILIGLYLSIYRKMEHQSPLE